MKIKSFAAWHLAVLFLALLPVTSSCTGDDSKAVGSKEYIPKAPDYADNLMWYSEKNDVANTGGDVFYVVSTWEADWKASDGRVCHYADVWNEGHRSDMLKEITKVAKYMGVGNNFYSPFYRHTTIEAWATQNEDTVRIRTAMPMDDVKNAFDHFVKSRQKGRPFVLAGFSQGAKAVVELLKHMSDDTAKDLAAAYVLGYKVTPDDTLKCKRIKAAQNASDIGVTICYNTVKDVKFISPVVSAPCAMCINPVNWKTDATPAVLNDTITVAVNVDHHVVVVKGYSGSEYAPILGFLNVGDIHSCEPWLYSECLKKNIATRIEAWRKRNF